MIGKYLKRIYHAAVFAVTAYACLTNAYAEEQAPAQLSNHTIVVQFGQGPYGSGLAEANLPYLTIYRVTREQMPQIIGVDDPSKCTSTAVMDWFKAESKSHYWARVAEIEKKGARYDVLPTFQKQIKSPSNKILTATNVVQAVDLETAMTNDAAWTVICYAQNEKVALRLAHTTGLVANEYEGQTVGLITGGDKSVVDYNDWTNDMGSRFKIAEPGNTTVVVTNAAGHVYTKGADGGYGVDNGEKISIVYRAAEGYVFTNGLAEATLEYTVNAEDIPLLSVPSGTWEDGRLALQLSTGYTTLTDAQTKYYSVYSVSSNQLATIMGADPVSVDVVNGWFANQYGACKAKIQNVGDRWQVMSALEEKRIGGGTGKDYLTATNTFVKTTIADAMTNKAAWVFAFYDNGVNAGVRIANNTGSNEFEWKAVKVGRISGPLGGSITQFNAEWLKNTTRKSFSIALPSNVSISMVTNAFGDVIQPDANNNYTAYGNEDLFVVYRAADGYEFTGGATEVSCKCDYSKGNIPLTNVPSGTWEDGRLALQLSSGHATLSAAETAYYSVYSVSSNQLASIMGSEPTSVDDVLNWFNEDYSGTLFPHFWSRKEKIVGAGSQWGVIGTLQKRVDTNSGTAVYLTATNMFEKATIADAKTSLAKWVFVFYEKTSTAIGVRIIDIAGSSECVWNAEKVGAAIESVAGTFVGWQKTAAKTFAINKPTSASVSSVTNSPGGVINPGSDGRYRIDKGETIYIVCTPDDGKMFVDNAMEATVPYTVDWNDITPTLPMIVPYSTLRLDESTLDSEEKIKFLPGDYLIVNLADGTVTESNNVQNADAFQDAEYKTNKMVFRKIPAGRFMMNCNSTAAGFNVALEQDYYLAIYECTIAQWEMATTGEIKTTENNTKPQYNKNWNAVKGVTPNSVIAKLRVRLLSSGYDIDLPNEAQWARAAHAGTTSNWYWGDQYDARDNYEVTGDSENAKGKTVNSSVVGSKLPNGWGFYDMLGNMREWCLDYWVSGIKATEQPGGPTAGTDQKRVTRGLSWGSGFGELIYQNHDNMRKGFIPNLTGTYSSDTSSAWYKNNTYNVNHIGCRLMLTKREPTNLDMTDGTTFVRGDYIVIDLDNKEVKQLTNVSEAEAAEFTKDDYKTKKMVFRKIPSGSFMKGATDNDNLSFMSTTGTKTTIDENYYIAIYECSAAQYEMATSGAITTAEADQMKAKGSLKSAAIKSFVSVFNEKYGVNNGCVFALPTENEWERAARAGTTTIYFFGSEMNNAYCWYDTPSSGKVQIIGTTSPNAWGLYDVLGNEPERTSDGTYGKICGGGVGNSAGYCTANYRQSNVTENTTSGFRLKLTCNVTYVDGAKDSAGNPIKAMVNETWAAARGYNHDEVTNANYLASNDLPLWKNYALGLEPTNSVSLPIVSSVQNSSPNTLDLSVIGINPHADSGVSIKYNLMSGATPASCVPTATTNDAPLFMEVPLPDATNPVWYWKVRVLFFGK